MKVTIEIEFPVEHEADIEYIFRELDSLMKQDRLTYEAKYNEE
jgi:hypothetical protein